MRQVFKILIINICVLVVAVYAIEAALYYLSPKRRLPYDGWIRGQRYTWGIPVVRNRFGFREREIVVPKPSHKTRIMLLGDSLTYGAGLHIDERYGDIAEGILKHKFPSKGLEVLNFARSGGPTTRELSDLEMFAPIIEPALIVIGFCFNDVQPKDQDYSEEKERFRNEYQGILNFFELVMKQWGLGYIGAGLHKLAFIAAEKGGVIPPWEEALGRVYDTNSIEWREFDKALNLIAKFSKERGLPPPIFMVLNQGTSMTGVTDYNNPDYHLKIISRWYHQAEKAAMSHGFYTFNFEPELRKLGPTNMVLNPLDGHPNALLNRLYGQKLADEISKYISDGRL